MKTKYVDLIEQTFDFPQEEFELHNNHIQFHGIDLSALIAQYGTPLKFSYLPKIWKKKTHLSGAIFVKSATRPPVMDPIRGQCPTKKSPGENWPSIRRSLSLSPTRAS